MPNDGHQNGSLSIARNQTLPLAGIVAALTLAFTVFLTVYHEMTGIRDVIATLNTNLVRLEVLLDSRLSVVEAGLGRCKKDLEKRRGS